MIFIKRLLGVFSVIMCITGICLAFTEKPSIPFIIEALIFGIIAFLLFRPTKKDKQRKAAKQEKLAQNFKSAVMKHVNGLPIAEDIDCTVSLTEDKIIFSSGAMNFELEKSKITDMCIKTDREILEQYTSSAGGAIAGAALFGPVGAIIGGRVKKKTIKNEIHRYLIITFKSEEIKYICLEIGLRTAAANTMVNDFKSRHTEKLNYQL